MAYLGVVFLLGAIIAGVTAYETHDAGGWVMTGLCVAAFVILTLIGVKKAK